MAGGSGGSDSNPSVIKQNTSGDQVAEYADGRTLTADGLQIGDYVSDKSAALNLLNASGYAFQLAVETLVTTRAIENVVVATREHPWVHEQAGRSGFIDLIIEKGQFRLVVECKRTTDALWLFLMPDAGHLPVHDFHGLWSMCMDTSVPASDWDRELISPPSPTSQFCCVRGQGEGQVAAIDRIGAELIYASEALAREERLHDQQRGCWPCPLRYVPVIVTNASLAVAKFDPAELDLASGKLDDCEVAPVALVRYRKAMDPLAVSKPTGAQSTRESNKHSQRSIFIVNVAALPQLLSELGSVQDNFRAPPWRAALERHRGQR